MPSRREKLIGILVEPRISFGQNVIKGVFRYYMEHGGWKFHTVNGLPYVPEERLSRWRGDGIIGIVSPKLAARLRRRGMPFVNVATWPQTVQPSVTVDNAKIGTMAAEYLLSKGLRRFALIDWLTETRYILRYQAFKNRVEQEGASCKEVSITFKSTRWGEGPDLKYVRKALKDQVEPLGVLTTYDTLARLVAEECEELGLRVPEDVAILGAGNWSTACELAHPQLSSVDTGEDRLGYRSAELLARLMDGGKVPERPIFIAPLRVIERQSTDLRAVNAPDVAKAIAFIRERVREPLQVADVLQAVPVNRRTLERQFRHVLGRTIYDEIRLMKVRYACELLLDTDLTIGRICQACGYTSRDCFNSIFRREMHMTPMQYRRQRNH